MSTLFSNTIDARFADFHAAHPEVFEMFTQYARNLREAGWTRYSADALLHRIRWHRHVDKGDRDFALNDHFSSRYARLLIQADPTFAGFFELRRVKRC